MDPETVDDALSGPDAKKWIEALEKEYGGDLMRNNIWELVERPKDKKVLTGKWVLVQKRDAHSNVVQSLKFILLLALHYGLSCRHVDFVTAFLNGPIDDDVEIYMEMPEYFDDGSDRVCKLRRCLYGLNPIFVSVYVDDLVIAGTDDNIELVMQWLRAKFEIKALGPVTDLLHMEISYVPDQVLWISQRGYIGMLLKRFGMESCRPVTTPQAVGNLPDPVDGDQPGVNDPNIPYRELVGALNTWCKCTYAYKSHKQSIAQDDTCSAEFIAAAECSVMIMWTHNLSEELKVRRRRPTLLFQDNQSTIKVIKSTKCNFKVKGVDLKYHKVKDLYERGDFDVVYCPTTDTLADIFTKPLGAIQFCKLRKLLNVLLLPVMECSNAS
ncbi:unnamed protein product [Phytophthora fragariaefolia]|uniref:Unnamed protein product n=1 Tax=Phytophthora fragariaefolia TaxID=1490495 RepID=A0A9W6WQL1_9STRA|nr:unnamed protein product [Phytophthora fragariaefolia]